MTELLTASREKPALGIDPDVSRLREHASTARAVGILITLVLAMECGPLAATVYYPATRQIADHFHTTQVAWGATIVTLAAACLTPVIAKAGDFIGKKKAVLLVMIAALLGSVLCATTSSFALFIVGRGLEGLSITAATISYGLIRDLMPRKLVPMAMGFLGTGLGVGIILAPFIAGWFVDGPGYKGLFWFLAIYSLVVMPMIAFLVPESALRVRRRFDVAGVALLAGAAGLILVALSNGSTWGWGAGRTVSLLVIGVVCAISFYAVELRLKEPMFTVRLLRSPAMAYVIAIAFFGLFPTMAFSYVMPQIAETPAIPHLGYGFGASATGYAVIAIGFGIMGTIFGPLGGYFAAKLGPRMPMVLAMGLSTVGMLGLVFWHTERWQMAVFATLLGIAYGCNFASTPNLIVEAVSAEEQSAGASLLAFAQNMGAAVVPVFVTLLYAQNVFLKDPRTGTTVPTDTGISLAIGIGVVGSAIALVLAVLMAHGRKPASGGAEPDDRYLLAD